MKNLLIISSVVFSFLHLPCLAQNSKLEEELASEIEVTEQRYILDAASSGITGQAGNTAIINQNGINNNSSVEQRLRSNSSDPNLMNIVQSGNLNNINALQSGNGNITEIQQHGVANSYEGKIVGEDNLTGIYQFGNVNQVNQVLQGNDMNYRLIQQGSNNQINQIENGQRTNQYEIRQQGSGMSVTVINGF